VYYAKPTISPEIESFLKRFEAGYTFNPQTAKVFRLDGSRYFSQKGTNVMRKSMRIVILGVGFGMLLSMFWVFV